ncbi:MAG: toprim domain-containing protein, partial [Flammeovirgaceae bacterium]
MCGDIPRIARVETHENVQPGQKLKLIKSQPIQHPALERYLQDRGINVAIAKQYLQEVRVKNKETGSSLFALGLLNEENGYEVRNSFFKGCVGKKAISVIRGKHPGSQGLHMFEGIRDFLSIVTDLPDGKLDHDAIVLNSLSNLGQVSAYIHRFGFTSLWTWMDNDKAGQKAKSNIDAFVENEAGLAHYPMNKTYHGFKDVNEWHVHNLKLRMEG